MRRRRILLLLTVLILLAGAACYGGVRTGAEIWSRLETGSVKIGIETFRSVETQEKRLASAVTVDCEKAVEYAPRITNYGADCHLRVRLLAEAGLQQIELVDYLEGIPGDWIRQGNYLYYRKVVSSGDSVVVCRGFRIPKAWKYDQDRNLQVRVEADALQAKNFHPDLTAENPWGSLVVTASRIEKGNRLERMEPAGKSLEEKTGNGCRVIVDQDQGLVLEEPEFFSHVSFLPGDSCRERLQLSNRETERVQILLKAEWEESPFLDQMRIRLDPGREIYDGILTGTDLKEYRLLAVLDPGETRTVDVTLSFPESADNPYQLNSDEIRWHFAVKKERSGWIPVTGEDGFRQSAAVFLCGTAFVTAWRLKRRKIHETAK